MAMAHWVALVVVMVVLVIEVFCRIDGNGDHSVLLLTLLRLLTLSRLPIRFPVVHHWTPLVMLVVPCQNHKF